MSANRPLLIGFSPSAYVRMVRLVALEKGVALARQELDPFQSDGPPAELTALNPFGKVPVLRHGALLLYETQAITSYLDEAFPGPALQPADPAERARMRQILGIIDAHAYRPLVWGFYVASREGQVREGAPAAARVALGVLEALAGSPWLLGKAVTLADCHLAPLLRYLTAVPEGRGLLEAQPALSDWWARCRERPGWPAVLEPEAAPPPRADAMKGDQSLA